MKRHRRPGWLTQYIARKERERQRDQRPAPVPVKPAYSEQARALFLAVDDCDRYLGRRGL